MKWIDRIQEKLDDANPYDAPYYYPEKVKTGDNEEEEFVEPDFDFIDWNAE